MELVVDVVVTTLVELEADVVTGAIDVVDEDTSEVVLAEVELVSTLELVVLEYVVLMGPIVLLLVLVEDKELELVKVLEDVHVPEVQVLLPQPEWDQDEVVD